MGGTGTTGGTVSRPANDVFGLLTDVDRLRSRQLQREVPASIDSLARALRETSG